jgi:hypothetical protein
MLLEFEEITFSRLGYVISAMRAIFAKTLELNEKLNVGIDYYYFYIEIENNKASFRADFSICPVDEICPVYFKFLTGEKKIEIG